MLVFKLEMVKDIFKIEKLNLKGVFAKNERVYRLTAENERF